MNSSLHVEMVRKTTPRAKNTKSAKVSEKRIFLCKLGGLGAITFFVTSVPNPHQDRSHG
jgi:hypothetical protein